MIKKQKINRILLINPPGKVYVLPDGTPAHRKHCTPPLGLAYLAANLRASGYDVHVIDMLAEGYTIESFHGSFIRYGLTTGDVLNKIKTIKPDVIGISVLFTFIINEVFELCAMIKSKYPEMPIILGGHHPSAAPVETMRCPDIDYILTAEADLTIVEFMNSLNGLGLLSQVPNLYYREHNEVKKSLNPHKPAVEGNGWSYYKKNHANIPLNLDELPLPDWDIFPMEVYWDSAVRVGGGDVLTGKNAVMVSSRGCPHACYFCPSPLTSGFRGYRERSIAEVVRELKRMVETYDIEEVAFLDDNFYANRLRAIKLMQALGTEFPNVLFSVAGGTEVNRLDFELIDVMKENNFYKVLIAIEAADQNVQNCLIDKKVKIERLPEMVAYLKKKGIETRALYMIGFPGETRAQIQKTIDLAKSLDVDDFYISIVTPMPGTPLYDECIEKGLFLDGFDVNDIRFSAAKIKLPDTSPEELERLRRETWLENFEQKRLAMQMAEDNSIKRVTDIREYETIGFTSIVK